MDSPGSAPLLTSLILRLSTLALGYITTDRFAGGRVAFGVIIPYGIKDQLFVGHAATPALRWNPAVPASTQAAVANQFNARYQALLAEEADSESGRESGLGDVELRGGWLYVDEKVRVLAGASIVLPTGRNNPGAGPDIGVGNFYTFRPAIQAAYLPTPNISISGKLTVGINTKNKDNNLRSGSWVGAEAALAYKSPIGAFGAHALYVQQYQDDTGNDWGSSRYRTFNIGPFFTTKIPVLNVSLTVQLIRTSSSRNAKAGDFSQIRMLKVF